jgi:hypothetical protein
VPRPRDLPAPADAPASPSSTPTAGSTDHHVALWILGALGVAGLATAGVIAYRAHVHQRELEAGGAGARYRLPAGRP